MKYLAALLGAFLLTAPAWAMQEEDAELDAKAKAKIEEFQDAYNKSKDNQERAMAIASLAEVRHPLIVKEAKKYLTKGGDEERNAAAGVLGAQKGDGEAARALLKSAKSQKNPFVSMAYIDSYASTGCWEAGKDLIQFFDDKNDGIAAAAIRAAGIVKHEDFVDPLIKGLWNMEQIKIDENRTMQADDDAVTEDPAAVRKQALEQQLVLALQFITGQQLENSDAFKSWWKDNKKTFKIDRGNG